MTSLVYTRALIAIAVWISLAPVEAQLFSRWQPVESSRKAVSINLKNPDGSRAAASTGTLWFTNRAAMSIDAQWNFETDQNGSATLHYATVYKPLNSDDTRSIETGNSYLVIPPGKGHAGTITDDYENHDIILEKGKTIKGRLVDVNGKGIPSNLIGTHYDLHVETHTGKGGEVLYGKVKSDLDGNFSIPGVLKYPITLSYDPTGYFWSQTTIDGVHYDDRVDEIEIPTTATMSRIILHCEPSPANVFQGTVVSMEDKPLSGAEVIIGYSHHRDESDYSDRHSSVSTITNGDGNWTLEVPTKRMTFGEVRFKDESNRSFSSGINLDTTAPQTVRLDLRPSDT